MTFYFLKANNVKWDYFKDNICIKLDELRYFGRCDRNDIYTEQIVTPDYTQQELSKLSACKMAYLLGEDIHTLVKEYKKWKLKQKS